MPVIIQSSGIIKDENTAQDGVENRDFKFSVQHTFQGAVIEWEFSLQGQPGTLEIDPLTGVITGNIKSLESNGESMGTQVYPEYDFRDFDQNKRSSKIKHPLTFSVLCEGKDQVGTQTQPWNTQASLTIEVIQDHGVNVLLFQKLFLDGEGNREPFTCSFKKPITQEHCEAIGGVWDEKHMECSIQVPMNPQDCQQIGQVWENDFCNIQMISEKQKCESQGYEWQKNVINSQSTYQELKQKIEGIVDSETLEIQDELI